MRHPKGLTLAHAIRVSPQSRISLLNRVVSNRARLLRGTPLEGQRPALYQPGASPQDMAGTQLRAESPPYPFDTRLRCDNAVIPAKAEMTAKGLCYDERLRLRGFL